MRFRITRVLTCYVKDVWEIEADSKERAEELWEDDHNRSKAKFVDEQILDQLDVLETKIETCESSAPG